MRYIMRLNGEFDLNPDDSVHQYDDLELALAVASLLQRNKVDTIIIHKFDGVPNAKRGERDDR